MKSFHLISAVTFLTLLLSSCSFFGENKVETKAKKEKEDRFAFLKENPKISAKKRNIRR